MMSAANDVEGVAILMCILCGRRFSVVDVRARRYFPSTHTCYICYTEGAGSNPERWCFGKPTKYDPEAAACQRECPDRLICQGYCATIDGCL